MYKSYEDLLKDILNNTNINIDKREGSFVSNMASPVAYELSKMSLNLQDVLNLAFIETNYDTFLDRRCEEYGLYRKLGVKSELQVVITTDISEYELNRITSFIHNHLEFDIKHRNDKTFDLIAKLEESMYNLDIGDTVLASSNLNIVAEVTKIYEIGINVESDEDLRDRFRVFIRDTQTSGNVNHYKHWATEVNGVHNVKVYPLWNGNGTVKVLISDEFNNPLDEDIINNCFNYISEVMPIGCTLTVSTVIPIYIDINATVKRNYGTDLAIKQKYTDRLNEFLSNEIGTAYYSKIYSLLGKLDEVEYIEELTINGEIKNVELIEEQVIIIREIEIIGL